MNEKYAVFKREEFEDFVRLSIDADYPQRRDDAPDEVEDAVVIRRQDVFAPPALDAYANAITVALELIKEGVTSSPEAVKLRAIADYFHEQAALAWDASRKLPD